MKPSFLIPQLVKVSWMFNWITCVSDVWEGGESPFLSCCLDSPRCTWKIYITDEIMSQQVNKDPTHLEVTEDAVFLGSDQSTGRRSREQPTVTYQEISSGGVTGTSAAFILRFHVPEQPLKTWQKQDTWASLRVVEGLKKWLVKWES